MQRILLCSAFVLLGSISISYANTALPSSNPTVVNVQEREIPISSPSASDEGERFILRSVRITGNTTIPSSALDPLIKGYVGKSVSLEDLKRLSREITLYCHSLGHLNAVAYLPPDQVSMDGSIEIRIVYAKLKNIEVQNLSKLSDSWISHWKKTLPKSEVMMQKDWYPSFYAIQNMPGIKVSSHFVPGKEPLSTTLSLKVQNSDPFSYAVYANNYGVRANGRNQLGARWAGDSLLLGGDQISLNYLVSNDSYKNYSFAYSLPIGYRGTRLGVSYSKIDYTLGAEYRSSNTTGLSKTWSFHGTTPLMLQEDRKVFLVYSYDKRKLESQNSVLTGFNQKRKSNSYSGNLGISGQITKNFYFGYNFIATAGNLTHRNHTTLQVDGNPISESDERGGLGTGAFYKFNGDLMYQTPLTSKLWLEASAHFQLANHSLDGSEQFVLGGPYGIRAYAVNQGSGDMGFQSTIEFTYLTSAPGLTVSAFYDVGTVSLKGENDPTTSFTLAGYGSSLHYRFKGFDFKVTYARKMKALPYISAGDNGKDRWWVEGSYHF